MSKKELQERIVAKAISSLDGIERQIRKYEEPIGRLTTEQREIIIESALREKEVWETILKLSEYV